MTMTPEQLRELAAQMESGRAVLDSGTIAKLFRAHADALEEIERLKARVVELELVARYAARLTAEVERALSDDGLCGREIDEVLSNALAERPAGFNAARSKP